MKDSTVIIVAVIVLVAVVVYLSSTGQINIPYQIGGLVSNQASISAIFHNTIDPYLPTWVHERHVACVGVAGTWFDQSDRMGCFSIPPGGFDSTSCNDPTLTYFRNICEGIDNADWVCDSSQVGCRY